MKFLKTVRFDVSDTFAFEQAAAPGTWAISGGFMFSQTDPADLTGKTRQAFENGFLSLCDFSWSSFVVVGELADEEYPTLHRKLSNFFMHDLGAPSEKDAQEAASEELAFAAEICADVSVNTIFRVQREIDEKGTVREAFHIIDPPREAGHTKAWELVEE